MIATAAMVFADGDWGHMDGGWWIVMMFGMILFWALVIVGVVWVVRELSGGRRHEHGGSDALAILDRRLADGSIAPDEYRERRSILTGSPPEAGGDSG